MTPLDKYGNENPSY